MRLGTNRVASQSRTPSILHTAFDLWLLDRRTRRITLSKNALLTFPSSQRCSRVTVMVWLALATGMCYDILSFGNSPPFRVSVQTQRHHLKMADSP